MTKRSLYPQAQTSAATGPWAQSSPSFHASATETTHCAAAAADVDDNLTLATEVANRAPSIVATNHLSQTPDTLQPVALYCTAKARQHVRSWSYKTLAVAARLQRCCCVELKCQASLKWCGTWLLLDVRGSALCVVLCPVVLTVR